MLLSFSIICYNNASFERGDTNMSNDNEILTIEEAAEYLRLGKRSIYKLAQDGKIPCKKILNKYRFVKSDLKKWVSNE